MSFEIQQLNKSFGQYQAVSNLNIKLDEGNILGMLGRNGAGKTTTIRMILDIIKPDSGSILWQGRPLSKHETGDWLSSRRAGTLSENECP